MKLCDPSARPLPRALLGQRAAVALHLINRCYTVSIDRKIQGYTPALLLRDVTTKVLPSGYTRCHREQRRNVHAWLLAELVDAGASVKHVAPPAGWRRITYHCKDGPPWFTFADDGERFTAAREALALPSGVWVPPEAGARAAARYQITVKTKHGTLAFHPYASREAALRALPEKQRLPIADVIPDTWQVVPFEGAPA